MAKNGSHLSLVRKSAKGANAELERRADSFIVAALTELSPKEQARLKQVVSSICRHEEAKGSAAMLGVQLGAGAIDDYRPVIMGSSENNPSLIRLSEPGVSLSAVLTTRLQETIEQIGSFPELSELTHTLEWGVIDGQIFYRREVADRTLIDLIECKQALSFTDAIEIARNIVSSIELLHSRGVAHGHLTCRNLSVAKDNSIRLLDPGIGLANLQAAISLGQELEISDEALASFAPETRTGEVLSLKADIYGLGQVLSKLFAAIGAQFEPGSSTQRQANSLHTLQDAFAAMADDNPSRRPSLLEIKQLLGQRELPKPLGGARKPALASTASQPAGQAQKVSIKRSGRAVGRHKPEVTMRHSAAWTSHNELTTEAPAVPAEQAAPAEQVAPVAPAAPARIDDELAKEAWTPAAPVVEEPRGGVADSSGAQVQATPAPQVAQPSRSKSGSWISLLLFLGGIGVAAYAVSGQVSLDIFSGSVEQEESFTKRELELAWYSKRPSLMIAVAESAVSKAKTNRFAEMLVVQSFLNNDLEFAGLNSELGRIVFDPRWEAELGLEDRRLALSLALSPLLRDKAPRDLITPAEAHPGVLLGIIATSAGNPRALSVLGGITAGRLAELPAPIGSVFKQLVSEEPDLSCADQRVVDLVRFATVGPSSAEEIIAFATPNPQLHTRYLATLYQRNDEAAKAVLAVLLQHPNLQLESPLVEWAKRWELYSWKGVSDSDKLMILSGKVPSGSVSAEHLAMFFSHPLATVRATAIGASIDSISFKHPSALPLLKILGTKADVLNSSQTFFLAQLLENPEQVKVEKVRQWLKSEPQREIVMALVVGSAGRDAPYEFDFELGRYLSVSGWEPSVSTLKGLAGHPEPFLRLVAYDKLFGLKDRKTAYKILKWALATETEPDYQSQLRRMSKTLKPLI